MPKPIDVLVRDHAWIHTWLGLIGNMLFFVGSILFLPAFEAWRTFAVWLFITGSFLMLVAVIGNVVAGLYKPR